MKHVKPFVSKLTTSPGGKTKTMLLWGDPLHETGETSGSHAKVKARGRTGWIKKADIGNQGLLEVYVIDVGQGDGVLLRTPDDHWHLIDAGVSNEVQMTKKGAANFIRWKFKRDLGRPDISLKNVILSHPDFDHYGGLLNLLSGDLGDNDPINASVENFYHCGMGRFEGGLC